MFEVFVHSVKSVIEIISLFVLLLLLLSLLSKIFVFVFVKSLKLMFLCVEQYNGFVSPSILYDAVFSQSKHKPGVFLLFITTNGYNKKTNLNKKRPFCSFKVTIIIFRKSKMKYLQNVVCSEPL